MIRGIIVPLNAGIVDMRGARGLAQRLSRLAGACAERALSQRRGVRRQGACKLPLQLSHLWRAACLARSSGRRPFLRPASRRTADAGAGSQGSPQTSRPAQGRRPAIGDRRQCARSSVHRRRPEPEVGGGLHLYLDRRRLALRRSRHRPVLTPRRWLVDERHDDCAACHRRAGDGDLATRQARCPPASLGPGQPVHQRAVPAPDDRQRHHLLDEPVGHVWDNAAMESFFSSLKTERIARKTFRPRNQARADVFDYIERFYNPTRRHSTLGYLSPMDFEKLANVA